HKNLTAKDLTALGIAAIIGAGIFSTIGNASASGGPAVIFLFLFTAVASGLSAFAYAEFASMVPVAGSAYTYSYVAFGELIAWLIGWSLIMEYSIGNIAVAISWSDYFTGLLEGLGYKIPSWLTMDYFSAYTGYNEVGTLLSKGQTFKNLTYFQQESFLAWQNAPALGSIKLVFDFPALIIIILITWLVYRGIKESKTAGNIMVLIKLIIILVVIAIGSFYIKPGNWNPFAPEGISGILKGVSAVFFAYIGFDAISTTAEECKDPQRDLPRGMMWSIIICTVLYIAIALVLTGMVNYKQLAVGDPLAFVFQKVNLGWVSGIIAFSAVIAMASVLLVFQLGQPRIWLSMSRDGLLPKKFSKIHPKYATPSFATIVTGVIVGVPALFMNLTFVTDLCSIGTLFAFVLVSGGVLQLHQNPNAPQRKFKTPYINSKFIVPILFLVGVGLIFSLNKENASNFLSSRRVKSAQVFYNQLSFEEVYQIEERLGFTDTLSAGTLDNKDLKSYLSDLPQKDYVNVLKACNVPINQIYESGVPVFESNIPTWIFIVVCVILTIQSFRKNLSLIPLLGLVSCLYMMSEIGYSNWRGFFIWLVIGLVLYFSYGYKNSKLNKLKNE
ncbi:MAG: amino acid permease, partial [Bacteroidia bacterium]|nr:amino acid permease [Bacteroidia bacterium]